MEVLFQHVSPVLGHMIEIENFPYEVKFEEIMANISQIYLILSYKMTGFLQFNFFRAIMQ